MRLLLSLLFTTFAAQWVAPTEQSVVQLMDQGDARREDRLAGYSVTEHYTLKASRVVKPAEMTVETVYRKGQGKTYQVKSRSGSSLVQSQVFDRILREQGEMSRNHGRDLTLVNSQNYEIHWKGEEISAGRNCYLMQLIPRTKSAHLLLGRAWIDKEDGSLVRIEGTPTADSSVFAGRPLINRQYENVGGFWVAHNSLAVSSSFISGKTELAIDYLDYHILN